MFITSWLIIPWTIFVSGLWISLCFNKKNNDGREFAFLISFWYTFGLSISTLFRTNDPSQNDIIWFNRFQLWPFYLVMFCFLIKGVVYVLEKELVNWTIVLYSLPVALSLLLFLL